MSEEVKNIPLKLFLRFESLKLKKLESRIFDQVDLGIAVSELDKEILQSLCPGGRLVTVENGVEVDKFRPARDVVERNTLVWVGGFHHFPNKQGMIFFLENIYPVIKRKLPAVRLDIVGGGITENMRDLCKSDESIRLLGYVEDPLPYVQKAAVFICPILSGGGTRLKILEAMSAGKAIVTTSIGCEGIDGKNGIHFIIADKAKDFSDAVIKVINNEELQETMGNNARDLVLNIYDWRIIIGKLNTNYMVFFKNTRLGTDIT